MPQFKPHDRLRALRELTGLTQKQLAERVWCKAIYIRSIEAGRRPLSDRLAVAITNATGVSLEWLTRDVFSAETPLNEHHQPYTREYFIEKFQFKKRHKDEIPVDDEFYCGVTTSYLESFCMQIACLLRAAHRTGHFSAARNLLFINLANVEDEITISEEGRSRTPAGPFSRALEEEKTTATPMKPFLTTEVVGTNGSPGSAEAKAAWLLVSPTAKFKWSEAMWGDDDARAAVISEFENLLKVVKTTLAQSTPTTPAKRARKGK